MASLAAPLLALALLAGPPASHAQRAVPPQRLSDARRAAEAARRYYPILLSEDGTVAPESLQLLESSLAPAMADPDAQIVLMVHGFNTSLGTAREEYSDIAAHLAAATAPGRTAPAGQRLRLVPIGVHWRSYPGAPLEWLPRVIGYRFLSELGIRKAVKSPYLETVALARRSGTFGMRTVLARLRAKYPRARIHAFAHSLGSEVVIRAVDPAAGEGEAAKPKTEASRPKPAGAVGAVAAEGMAGAAAPPVPEPPQRLGLVALAGADLDHDIFTTSGKDNAHLALDRVDLWWITVPRRNVADAALEFRRGTRRREAVGNVGLTLERPDFDRLMDRRGLFFDNRHVPIAHWHTEYYNRERVGRLVETIRYLRAPRPAPPTSELGVLDRILTASREQLTDGQASRSPSERLYVRWRLESEKEYPFIRLIEPPTSRR